MSRKPFEDEQTITKSHEEPAGFFIDEITHRPLDGGELIVGDLLERHDGFAIHQMSYRSDSLRITGLVAQPETIDPQKVVIINHGFFPFDRYYPGKGTKHELRSLANHGYFAFSPDYRNYGDSDEADTVFEPGYLYDVRNLFHAVTQRDDVDAGAITMLGHSMGAGITLSCMVTDLPIRAAAIIGTVPGNEAERLDARLNRWSGNGGGTNAAATAFTDYYGWPNEVPDTYARMSQENYWDRVQVPLIMHHGLVDPISPTEWSEAIYQGLTRAGKTVEYHRYPGAGHVLRDEDFRAMIERTTEFFARHQS